MEERAPGGERMRRPKEWLVMLAFRDSLDEDHLQRARRLPDRPMTRFEYIEAMAFATKEEH